MIIPQNNTLHQPYIIKDLKPPFSYDKRLASSHQIGTIGSILRLKYFQQLASQGAQKE
jgi:hypothetical protein